MGSGSWSWPADGQVLNRYTESDSKGVDIAGTRNAPVRAAANGRVVYQGSGLRGYGQLIIIKHNDEFLSAYAHNDRIHVKEGDAVKRGQKIADMGSTGTDRVKLHFEIRRQGVPVDPLKYLPSR
jgi:lipoprotein NlpD